MTRNKVAANAMTTPHRWSLIGTDSDPTSGRQRKFVLVLKRHEVNHIVGGPFKLDEWEANELREALKTQNLKTEGSQGATTRQSLAHAA